MSIDDSDDSDLNAQIDARIDMSAAARKTKQMVLDRFVTMIDNDPEKAVNTIRALLRKE